MRKRTQRKISPEERALRDLEYKGDALERDLNHFYTRVTKWRNAIEVQREVQRKAHRTCPRCGAELGGDA